MKELLNDYVHSIAEDVQSPERLLDETALFLHRVDRCCHAAKHALLERLHSLAEILRGRKVLESTTTFQHSPQADLRENQLTLVSSATNGRQAIEIRSRRATCR